MIFAYIKEGLTNPQISKELLDIDLFSLWPFQHSMVYFFHHYELPAILHQARIQHLLAQSQQQTAQVQQQTGPPGGPTLRPGEAAASSTPATSPPATPATAAGEASPAGEAQPPEQSDTAARSPPDPECSPDASTPTPPADNAPSDPGSVAQPVEIADSSAAAQSQPACSLKPAAPPGGQQPESMLQNSDSTATHRLLESDRPSSELSAPSLLEPEDSTSQLAEGMSHDRNMSPQSSSAEEPEALIPVDTPSDSVRPKEDLHHEPHVASQDNEPHMASR